MATFRKGDVVTIQATIAGDPFNMDDGAAKVRIEFPPHNDAYVDPVNLKMLRPHLVVRDAIEWTVGEKTYRGEVLAIADDHAWVHLGGGEYATVWLSNATRLDLEPCEDAA